MQCKKEIFSGVRKNKLEGKGTQVWKGPLKFQFLICNSYANRKTTVLLNKIILILEKVQVRLKNSSLR